jgi:hypothetical protein
MLAWLKKLISSRARVTVPTVLAYAIIPSLSGRCYTTYLDHSWLSAGAFLPYLRGFLSDISIGLVIGPLLLLFRFNRFLFYTLWAIWVMLISLNAEHVFVNASNMNYKFIDLALTRDFIGGSLITVKNLYAFIICLAFSILLTVIYRRLRLRILPMTTYAITAVSLITIALLPVSKVHPNWIQTNIVEENVRNVFSGRGAHIALPDIDEKLKDRFFSHDLSGSQIVAFPESRTNVLIIMVEGISQSAIDAGDLPNLKKLSDGGLSYDNFFNLQHQTNRGMYSIVCGDYPNFLSEDAKPDYVGVYGPQKKCIPEMLKPYGYHSVFMQSARLEYMRKDKFAEKVGYDDILGNSHYDRALGRNEWGVDDRTLYSYALGKVQELSDKNKLWFMTLLTTSTHHPFNVPGVYSPTHEQALEYADRAVAEFIASLRDNGLLDRTLVLITSDESSGGASGGLEYELNRNRAPFIVLVPAVTKGSSHNDLFAQSDIQLSIADYLGMDTEGLIGRSIFREYSKGRDLIVGNVYASKIYYIDRKSKLYICNYDINCAAYRIGEENFLVNSLEPIAVEDADISMLREVLAYNEFNSVKFGERYVFYEANTSYKGNRYLLGDYKLSLKRGDTVIWKFQIRSEGVIGVRSAVHEMKHGGGSRNIFEDKKWVNPGENYRYSRKVTATAPMNLWTNITVTDIDKAGYTVDYLTVEVQKNSQ